MKEKIRWGILGTGSIARKFAKGLAAIHDAELMAVGSRAQDTAERFAKKFNVPHPHASYEELASDTDVDVIYIATPHSLHRENSILCLEAGKAVLCEKPFTINAKEAEDVIRVARERKVFLMEAMWTRFLPAVVKVREMLEEGKIGEVRMVQADFGFRAPFNPQSRIFNPELGGGALLDVGVYCVSFTSMILGGPPEKIVSMAHLGESGIDEQSAMILGYNHGRLAVLWTAVRTPTHHQASIFGTEGNIRLPAFWHPDRMVVSFAGKEKKHKAPFKGNGYLYEAEEVMRCLREGKLESDVMPLEESLSIMKTMDQIRWQWDLKYPME